MTDVVLGAAALSITEVSCTESKVISSGLLSPLD
jgi:hypothetical protein